MTDDDELVWTAWNMRVAPAGRKYVAPLPQAIRSQLRDREREGSRCTCIGMRTMRCVRHKDLYDREVPCETVPTVPPLEPYVAPSVRIEHDRVMALWPTLTPKQQEAVEARVRHNRNDRSAARELGIDESTLREHLRAARRKLIPPQTPVNE